MATMEPMGQPIFALMFWGMIVCVILELEIFLALRKSMIPGLILPVLYFLAAIAWRISCAGRSACSAENQRKQG